MAFILITSLLRLNNNTKMLLCPSFKYQYVLKRMIDVRPEFLRMTTFSHDCFMLYSVVSVLLLKRSRICSYWSLKLLYYVKKRHNMDDNKIMSWLSVLLPNEVGYTENATHLIQITVTCYRVHLDMFVNRAHNVRNDWHM
jgi:hypothetical protein